MPELWGIEFSLLSLQAQSLLFRLRLRTGSFLKSMAYGRVSQHAGQIAAVESNCV